MNLKEVKHRIQSVKNTQKITSAMKRVSSAKLHRSQAAIDGMRPYSRNLNRIFTLSLCGDVVDNAFTTQREVKRVAIIPIASDTGLCGTFNSNIVRLAKETINGYISKGVNVEIMTSGRKMADAIKKMGLQAVDTLLTQSHAPGYSLLASVATTLMERFQAGEIDKVDLVYTQFRSLSKQQPVVEQLLPVVLPDAETDALHATEYIIEPGREELFKSLLPKVVSMQLYTAFLDSVAAEHSARMIAMQAATENAQDLISELTLEYNKGRQQAITNEILDIVSGSNL